MKKRKILALVMSMAMLLGVTAWTNADEADEIDVTEVTIEESASDETTDTSENSEEESDEVIESDNTEITEETSEIIFDDVDVIDDSTEDVDDSRDSPENIEEVENLYNYEDLTNYEWGEVPSTEYALCDLEVRSIADPNGEVVTSVAEGSTVSVLAICWDSPWYYVEANGVRGFVNCLNILPQYNADIATYSDEEAESMWAN